MKPAMSCNMSIRSGIRPREGCEMKPQQAVDQADAVSAYGSTCQQPYPASADNTVLFCANRPFSCIAFPKKEEVRAGDAIMD